MFACSPRSLARSRAFISICYSAISFIWLVVQVFCGSNIKRSYLYTLPSISLASHCGEHTYIRDHLAYNIAREHFFFWNVHIAATNADTITNNISTVPFVEVVCCFSRYCSALWNFHVIFKYRERTSPEPSECVYAVRLFIVATASMPSIDLCECARRESRAVSGDFPILISLRKLSNQSHSCQIIAPSNKQFHIQSQSKQLRKLHTRIRIQFIWRQNSFEVAQLLSSFSR